MRRRTNILWTVSSFSFHFTKCKVERSCFFDTRTLMVRSSRRSSVYWIRISLTSICSSFNRLCCCCTTDLNSRTQLWSCTSSKKTLTTSKVTSCHRGPCARGAPWRVLLQFYYAAVLSMFFSLSSVVSCPFSAHCVYLMFRHHPHPLGYLCAKFCFFCSLHCWASPWKNIAYSITHLITQSLTQLIWCARNRSLHFGKST